MFVDNLQSKINDSIQSLAKMLDLIHKFASKQRQQYFSIIKNLQMQLNTLKANLKESNALQIQKQYNTIYLNINSLCSQIQDFSQIMANKQNRDHNRVTPIRQSKRNQEEAFRLIAEKEDEINRLKLQNFEKEELIKINYQELMDYKKEYSFLIQQCKLMKNDIAGLETQISRLNEELLKKEQQHIDLKLVDQQRERFLRSHLEELDISNKELEVALSKIHYFEDLAEISMNKTQVVEQNMKQLQNEAQKLQQNYKVKQNENIKNNRKIEELQIQIRKKQTRLNVSQQQNRRIKEDMNQVEQQLTKLNQMIYELRIENKREREVFNSQKYGLTHKLQIVSKDNQNLKKELKLCEDKFVEIFNKYSQMQEEHQRLKVSSISRQKELNQSQEQVRSLQNKIRLIQKQHNFTNKEKQILNQQLTKSLGVNKELEIETNKLKQLLKAKQSQRIKLSVSLQNSNSKLKSLQRDQIINQRSIKSLIEQINEYKLKIVRLQQGRKSQSNEIQGLKMRLLKAKIQTIHQLRSNLS